MHRAKYWPLAFIVLFVAYHAPYTLDTPLLMLAFLPIAWWVARKLGHRMGTAYALEWNCKVALLLIGGFALAVLAKVGALLVGTELGIYAQVQRPPTDLWQEFAWVTLSTFFPSIAEDVVTRGFWARLPGWQWTAWRFVMFSSLVYVLNHIYRLGNGPTEWLMLFCYGFAYATAFWRTGTLWAAVGLHWGWNFAGMTLGEWWSTPRPGSGWWLSSAAHLLLAGACLLLINRPVGVAVPGPARAPGAEA